MEVGTGLAHPMSPKGLRIVRGWEARGTGSEMHSDARGKWGQGLQQWVIYVDEIQLHEHPSCCC